MQISEITPGLAVNVLRGDGTVIRHGTVEARRGDKIIVKTSTGFMEVPVSCLEKHKVV